jgi:hypothetical protein
MQQARRRADGAPVLSCMQQKTLPLVFVFVLIELLGQPRSKLNLTLDRKRPATSITLIKSVPTPDALGFYLMQANFHCFANLQAKF